jgi:hypothetical protein
MALQFVAASSQHVNETITGWSSSGTPCTLAAWCSSDTNPASMGAVTIVNISTFDANSLMSKSGKVNAGSVDQGANFQEVDSFSGLFMGPAYSRIAATFGSTSNRVAVLDAQPGTAGTTSVNVAGVDRLYFGWDYTGGTWDGRLCGLAAWDVVLTDAELNSLYKDFPPRRIRPQSLRAYVPAVRNLFDWRTGAALTVTNGPLTVAVHNRCYGS